MSSVPVTRRLWIHGQRIGTDGELGQGHRNGPAVRGDAADPAGVVVDREGHEAEDETHGSHDRHGHHAEVCASRLGTLGGGGLGRRYRRHRSPSVCFQVDHTAPGNTTGWSVMVKGRAVEVIDPDEVRTVEKLEAIRLALHERPHWIRIVPSEITGRRLGWSVGRHDDADGVR